MASAPCCALGMSVLVGLFCHIRRSLLPLEEASSGAYACGTRALGLGALHLLRDDDDDVTRTYDDVTCTYDDMTCTYDDVTCTYDDVILGTWPGCPSPTPCRRATSSPTNPDSVTPCWSHTFPPHALYSDVGYIPNTSYTRRPRPYALYLTLHPILNLGPENLDPRPQI